MKILVELFDNCQLANVVSDLHFLPEHIIFVGCPEVMTEDRVNALERFLRLRKRQVELSYEYVERDDFDGMVQTFQRIVDTYPDCCFDLTGGKELMLVAMGIVSAQKQVPMLHFQLESGGFVPVQFCEKLIPMGAPQLTIRESVTLNGGAVLRNDEPWQMTSEFCQDIQRLWDICKNDPRAWNKQAKRFGQFEAYRLPESLQVRVAATDLKTEKIEDIMNSDICDDLLKQGFLLDYSVHCNRIRFRYKNEQIHRCLIKGGNILELYAYVVAHEINRSAPGYYGDIGVGVNVDWDGVFHAYWKGVKETRNEIDLILMRDMIPIFISCKNGDVHKEALYELATIAEKYGGPYARKILLTTHMSGSRNSREFLLQRAKDMGIKVIQDIDDMTKQTFMEKLKTQTE